MSDVSAEAPADVDAPVAGPEADPGAGRYKWYVLSILTIVYTFNFVDRQIIAIVSPALKEDLGLSDSMLGLLKGPAFAVLYTTLGIPIAWLADRYNRVNIVAAALAIWSGFTALSGLAANVLQLSLARVGVGIGEAGCSPPSHALIADYFPKERRASALAIYSLGIPFGQMVAFVVGGVVVQLVGWREAFFLVGLPGIALAVILKLTVREPVRGGLDAKATDVAGPTDASSAEKSGGLDGLKTLFSIRSYLGVTAGITLSSFTGYGIGLWVVDFYRRTYDLSFIEITIPLAILNGVAYGVGTYLGGFLTDRVGARDRSAYMWIPAVGMLITIPTGLLSVWAPAPFWAFFWSAPYLIALGLYLGPSFSVIQTLAPLRFRAFATAVMFFILNLIALGGAPIFVGAVSQAFTEGFGEATALRIALSTLGVSSLAAALAFFWTSRQLPGDWDRAARRL